MGAISTVMRGSLSMPGEVSGPKARRAQPRGEEGKADHQQLGQAGDAESDGILLQPAARRRDLLALVGRIEELLHAGAPALPPRFQDCPYPAGDARSGAPDAPSRGSCSS